MKEKMFPFLKCTEFYFKKDVWSHGNSRNTNFMLHSPIYSKQNEYSKLVKVMCLTDYDELRKWENTATLKRGKEYEAYKDEKAIQIINQIDERHPGFKNNISSFYTSTPLTFRDYTSTKSGSAYGIIHDFRNPMKTNIPLRTKIKNLYLTGQNVNFHGMLGVSVSSVLTCNSIKNI